MIRTTAIQKFGIDSPSSPTIWNNIFSRALRVMLATIPSGRPKTVTQTTVSVASSIVIGSREIRRPATGWLVRNDHPRFPWSMLQTHSAYWIGSGLSRPKVCSMARCCSALSCPSVPAMISTIVPGSSRIRMKMSSETPSSAAVVHSRRRRRYRIAAPAGYTVRRTRHTVSGRARHRALSRPPEPAGEGGGAPRSVRASGAAGPLAEPRLLQEDAPPGERLGVPLQLGGQRFNVELRVPPPVGRLVEQGALNLDVEAPALIVIEDRPGLLHQGIQLRVPVPPIVDRPRRIEVRVDVPVRIGAEGVGRGEELSALLPAGLELGVVVADERPPFLLHHLHVDPQLLEGVLHDQRGGDKLGVLGGAFDLDFEPTVGVPGLGQEV